MKKDRILLGHGSGGKLTHQLIDDLFVRHFSNPELDKQTDAALLNLDPGHLALCGEPLPMAFDMAADWLVLVAIKDSIKIKREDGSVHPGFLPLGDGFVDWEQMWECLLAQDYTGPLSFHSEFPADSTEYLMEQTKKDMAYLRAVEQRIRNQA